MSWLTLTEVRLGLRLIRKQPFLALTAVLALATGIGFTVFGFTVYDCLLAAELPFAGGERFVRLRVSSLEGGRQLLDLEHYRSIKSEADQLEYLGAISGGQVNLLHASGEVEPLRGAYLTPGTFRYLPAEPLLGRTLIAADGRAGAEPVAVIRESLWQRSFAADPQVLGRQVTVGETRHLIVGVVSDELEFPLAGELWLALEEDNPGQSLRAFGVLRQGTSLAAAEAEIATLSQQLSQQRATADPPRITLAGFTDIPGEASLLGGVVLTVLLLLLAVIAANVANLLLARTSARHTELAVRTALGAARWRLIGQLSAEAALLGALGAIFGTLAAGAALRWYSAMLEPELPFWIDFTPQPRSVLIVVAATLLATVICGLLPAFKATRRDLGKTLRPGFSSGHFGLGRLGTAMMIGELALSVAFLTGALVTARGFLGYMDQRYELPRGQVLTAQIVAPQNSSGAATELDDTPYPLATQVEAALRDLPGVRQAGLGNRLPRTDAPALRVHLETVTSESTGGSAGDWAPVARIRPGFLEAVGARVVAGRLLEDSDLRPDALPVVVVNEPFVAKFLGGRNPIGRRLRVEEPGLEPTDSPWREIVGVVPDLALSPGDAELAGGLYLPLEGSPFTVFVALQSTQGDPNMLAGALRQAMVSLDPAIQVRRILLLEDVGDEERAFLSGLSVSLTLMGAIALLLSLAGTYAMMSFNIVRRTREIGVRVALGASQGQVLRSILGRAGLHLLIGAGLGCALGLVFLEAKAILVARLPTSGGWVLPPVLLLLLLAGLVASWVPAKRVLAIQPMDALRFD